MPDTVNYLILGYVVGLGIFALTVGSVWWRYRNLAADEAALETLEKEVVAQEAAVPSRSELKEAARVN